MTYKIRGESVPVYDGFWKSSGLIFPNRVNLLRKREGYGGAPRRSKPLHFSRPKTYVVEKIENITAIVTHTLKLWIPLL